jgi:predicted transglutaminase-like cysteine proteinase
MRRLISIVLGSGLLVLLPAAASGEAVSKRPAQPSPFMRIYGPALPPYGFVQYCERSPSACAETHGSDERPIATPGRIAELDQVNRTVNTAIQPATDIEIYGVTEHWAIPTERGDCEDYVLLKRRILLSLGWPASALLITVVRDENGEGHAILTARTSQGDFILDNKVGDVKLWHRTGYQFLMRQSYVNPTIWLSLDPSDAGSPQAIAGVRSDPRQP